MDSKKKISVKEAILVEGKYDKIKLTNIVDTHIIVSGGFSVFHNNEKREYIRKIAQTQGLIVLTDSDSAGFKIRSYIKQDIDKNLVKHAYIPDIVGKEKRKATASSQGFLGVEGIDDSIILDAIKACGATIIGNEGVDDIPKNPVTKLNLYQDGFLGSKNSSHKRAILLKALSLPSHLSTNGLVDAINMLLSLEEYKSIINQLDI